MLELGRDDQIMLLMAALVLIVLIGFLVANASRRQNGRTSHFSEFKHAPPPDFSDVGQQLHFVMAGSFQRRRLLNFSEYRVFKVIDHEIATAQRGHRVFAQTSLGEVLQSPDANAFRSINSKRVDFLIVDGGGWPVLAVEYQGPGHYQGKAAARDAIKKEALRKAGVAYVEISEADSDAQIRARVRQRLGWETVAAPLSVERNSPDSSSPDSAPPENLMPVSFGRRRS
jgi:hypothetical protein